MPRMDFKRLSLKSLRIFATVHLQQDWKATKNNPLLLTDCPWEHFFTNNERILQANRKPYM